MRKKKALWITIAIAVILLVTGAVVLAEKRQANTVPEGISFNGNSLAGLTPDEAKEKITEYMTYFNSRTIEIKLGEQTKTLTMNDIEFVIAGEKEALSKLEEAIPYGNVFERYKQEKDLEKEPVDIRASVSYNEEILVNTITEFAAANEVTMEEPTYRKEGNSFITTPGATGIAYDETKIIVEVKKLLEEAVPDSGKGSLIQYTAQATITQPTLGIGAYDNLNANVLGTFTTLFDSGNGNRTTNIELACNFLNGIVLLPGQEASLLDILKVSYANGYKDAGTIINGKTEDDLGGGVCQVATTLYDALLMSEIEITYRRNHSLASTYVDYSWDAMIHPSGADFKFKNNLSNPIYIEAGIARQGEKSPVTITIYGTEYRPANRRIEYYSKILSSTYSEPYYIVNRWTPSNLPAAGKNYSEPRLYAERTVTAAPAVKAELWKRVIVDGNVISDTRVNGSSYKGTQGIFYVAWDMTVLVWMETDARGLNIIKYALRDGRYWDPSKETEVNLANAVIYPWTGQGLNEDGSVYVPPTTEAPTTQAPTTQAPTTQAPTTQAPTTTEEPTTEEVTTPSPTTTVAPTEAPTTTAAPTEAPTTTVAPTTEAPTTTAAPTTEAPTTTAAPTTEAPTTVAPTTIAAPTTEAATTVAPASLSVTESEVESSIVE